MKVKFTLSVMIRLANVGKDQETEVQLHLIIRGTLVNLVPFSFPKAKKSSKLYAGIGIQWRSQRMEISMVGGTTVSNN